MFLILLILCWQHSPPAAATRPNSDSSTPPHTICFSPGGDCTGRIRDIINQAQESVLVQAYSLTSSSIGKALVNAHKRGVKVEVIVDGRRANTRHSQIQSLNRQGVVTLVDNDHTIAHNKLMIIDSKVVVTGSLNFSRDADERNAENTLILRDEGLATIYTRNYQRHRKHSSAYRASR